MIYPYYILVWLTALFLHSLHLYISQIYTAQLWKCNTKKEWSELYANCTVDWRNWVMLMMCCARSERSMGHGVGDWPTSYHNFSAESHCTTCCLVSQDTCIAKAAVNGGISSRQTTLRGVCWSGWKGQVARFVKSQQIPIEMCPRCSACGEDGWRRDMWHVRGV